LFGFLNKFQFPSIVLPLIQAAFKAVMRKTTSSDRTGYDSLLQVYKDTNLSQEKSRILGSLASSPDPVMVKEALDFAVSSEVCETSLYSRKWLLKCRGHTNVCFQVFRFVIKIQCLYFLESVQKVVK
jgi:hypothetical protein